MKLGLRVPKPDKSFHTNRYNLIIPGAQHFDNPSTRCVLAPGLLRAAGGR